MYRFALLSLLVVGCIPPPTGGYQTQSYARQSAYSQQNGYGYWRQNGYSQQNGYDDEEYEDGYGSSNSGYGNGGNSGGGGSWTCDAVAVQDDGSTRKSAYGQGSSRDEAATNALRDCGALAGFDQVVTNGRGGGNCQINNCFSTGG